MNWDFTFSEQLYFNYTIQYNSSRFQIVASLNVTDLSEIAPVKIRYIAYDNVAPF